MDKKYSHRTIRVPAMPRSELLRQRSAAFVPISGAGGSSVSDGVTNHGQLKGIACISDDVLPPASREVHLDSARAALLKKMLDEAWWELREDANGEEYLYTTRPVVSARDVIAYSGEDVLVPSVYAGIPIDNATIYWENGILKAQGGGGGGTDVSWGNESNYFVPLSVGDTVKTVALSGHQHALNSIFDLNSTWKSMLETSPGARVTRWPTWNEVTNKPSTFKPSTHYHDRICYNNTMSVDNLALLSYSTYMVAYKDLRSEKNIYTTLGGYIKSDSYLQAKTNVVAGSNVTAGGNVVADGDVIAYSGGMDIQAAFRYWRPYVDSSGYLRWTNSTSEVTPTAYKVKGEKGDTGTAILASATFSSEIVWGASGTQGILIKRNAANTGVRISGNIINSTTYAGGATSTSQLGNLYLNYTSSTSNVRVSNDAKLYVRTVQVTSDERFKNIGDKVTAVLNEVERLSVFEFAFKDATANHKQIGVSAQEVQAVWPALVSEVKDEGCDPYLTVDYAAMAAMVSIVGLKELHAKVKTQAAEIKELQRRIQS